MTTKVKDSQAAQTKDEDATVKYWLDQLEQSRKREKNYVTEAREAVDIYEATKKSETAYNILYANTETLQPAIYSQLPRPQVTRRYKDEDVVGKAAAQVTQRMLEYVQDTNEENYESFNTLMQAAVLDALVPGRGVVRWKFDATTAKVGEGTNAREEVTYDAVCGEQVPWDRFHHGYAKQWKDVPWVGFDHYFTRDEALANFPDVGAELKPTASEQESENGKDAEGATTGAHDEGESQLIVVHEIWNKVAREVVFVSPGLPGKIVKRVADPFKLTGFFPCQKPLCFMRKVKTLVPTPLYTQYRAQATELNKISARIIAIIGALKVRGVYDARIGELGQVFESAENEFIPAESMKNMDPANVLDKSIWFMPIEKLISVLQQLYLQREQIKKVIFELTGLADIVRGSSAASESATAQSIKDRWSSIRLKSMQREVARFARDGLRIIAEIGIEKLRPQTIAQMTAVPLIDAGRKAAAQTIAQQAQAGGQPVPPEIARALQTPTWDDVLGLLRNDRLRSYKVDIETNSTVDLDVTEDKRDISEMMGAMGQFLNGIGPLVRDKALPFDAARSMLLAISRRFRFGTEIEDDIRQMKQPQQPDDSAAQAAKLQADQQLAQAQLQAEQQEAQARMALEREKAASDFALAQQKMQQELVLARERMALDAQLAREKQIADAQRAERDAQAKRAAERSARELDAQLRREEIAANAAAKRQEAAHAPA